ncbi:MAG: hypothetical protein ABI833_16050 [Acidobacteriota bacterium]
MRKTFANVPLLWESELERDYYALGEALGEMTVLDEGEDWKIDAAVFSTACYVALELKTDRLPAPRIFTHGPKSVVFNWSRENDNLYLTISANRISALVSSPERIKRRVDMPVREFANQYRAVSLMGAAYPETAGEYPLIAESVPDPLEAVAF